MGKQKGGKEVGMKKEGRKENEEWKGGKKRREGKRKSRKVEGKKGKERGRRGKERKCLAQCGLLRVLAGQQLPPAQAFPLLNTCLLVLHPALCELFLPPRA